MMVRNYKYSFLFLLLFVSNLTLAQGIGGSPYPIIFVHGLVGNDQSFQISMEYLANKFSFDSIYVFDVVLNADNSNSTSLLTSDVKWVDFVYQSKNINVGRRTFADDPINFKDGWSNSSARIFAINFQEERIRGAFGTLNDFFDYSNEAAIYKQGKALREMIREVINFTKCEKVILVGHSMGGLAIREYLQRTNDGTTGSDHSWWIDPNSDDGHKVAKVVTIGTPHGGSNYLNVLESIWPPNPNSEATRDLRYNYNSWISLPPNPAIDDGVYLFGGSENYSEMRAQGFFNYDINCDGDDIDNNITGITSWISSGGGFLCRDNSDMPLPNNVLYTWITSDNGGVEDGDGVVRLDRQFLANLGDTLLTNYDHEEEPDDIYSIIRGLDEADNTSSAFRIDLDRSYNGFITYQSNFNSNDDDYYWFNFLEPRNLIISIDGNNSGVQTVTIVNEGNDIVNSFNITNFPSTFEVNLCTGKYYLKISGNAYSSTWQNPYSFKISAGNESPDLTYIEYFFDEDPGVGNGQSISVSSAPEIIINTTLDITLLSGGLHNLFIRAMDICGSISTTYSGLFLKEDIVFNNPYDITRVEYYIDDDPGFGNGVPITMTPGTNLVLDLSADLTEWDTGIHNIFIRGMNSNGKWSLISSRMFLIEDPLPINLPKIVELEYYFDDDPGLGGGISIPITEDYIIINSSNLELNSVTNGLHTLLIRAKDGNGKWSFPSHQLFSKESDAAAISRIEYFYVKDATITETYEFTDFTPSLNLETNFSAYLPDLDVDSDYNLVIKAYDKNGLPSLLNTHQFTVTPSPLAAPVLNSPLNLSQNQQPNLNFSWFNSLPSEQILQKKSNKEKKNLPGEKTSFRIENFDGPDADTITYRIQLASDFSFYDVVFDDSTLIDTTNNISSLENDSTFYWRVRGYSSSLGKGDWSEKRSFSTISPIKLNVKAFLEGPYNLTSGIMDTSLSNENRLPKFQPFNLPPYSYNGTEQVDTIPTSIVDWVLVELRENLFSNSMVKRKAGFINKFGEVVDLEGKNNLKIEKTNEGNYYTVLWHRNHLGIMSSVPLSLSSTDSALHSFTLSMESAYGNNPMKNLGGGLYGMYAGDGDRDGDVDYEDDVLSLWLPNFGFDGYYFSDYNLNGSVDYDQDLLNYWLYNFGYSSQVPDTLLARPLNIVGKNLNDILIRKQNDKLDSE